MAPLQKPQSSSGRRDAGPGPTTSKTSRRDVDFVDERNLRKRIGSFLYNKEEQSFCGRTCVNWSHIIMYSIVYVCFLCSFTLICLYCSLVIIKKTIDFEDIKEIETELLTYSRQGGIGLTATPTYLSSQPIIWYRKDNVEDYQKYIKELDNLLVRRRKKRDVKHLGPCGVEPYGYGDKPCVILRINKQLYWSGRPLEANSTETEIAPLEVRNRMRRDKKLWLHCEGDNSYDKEHIGRIRYFPDPPGFDPKEFPLKMDTESAVVAIQISGFTIGVSLAVKCNVWHINGPSSITFVLYVADNK